MYLAGSWQLTQGLQVTGSITSSSFCQQVV